MEVRYNAAGDRCPLQLYVEPSGRFKFPLEEAAALARDLSKAGAFAQVWDGRTLLHDREPAGTPREKDETLPPDRAALQKEAFDLLAALTGYPFKKSPAALVSRGEMITDLCLTVQHLGIAPIRIDADEGRYPWTDADLLFELKLALPTTAAELALAFLVRFVLEPDNATAREELQRAACWTGRSLRETRHDRQPHETGAD